MPSNGEHVRFKNYDRKIKSPIMIYASMKVYYCVKILKNKIHTCLIRTNIKNMLLVVTAINY